VHGTLGITGVVNLLTGWLHLPRGAAIIFTLHATRGSTGLVRPVGVEATSASHSYNYLYSAQHSWY
jgi:hypothetical protein